ncbi:MAG: ABC transporter ATP-binding protein [Pseudomonadota bacterium]|nr:ABC transporter ATP-binding protein [Pseudomonadota bacterium]
MTVSLRGVSKKFGSEQTVLQDIDLDLGASDFVSLIGPSGCGKSTLLRIIAGIVEKSSGTISFSDDSKDNQDISFVFQEPTLLPWLTVDKNVQLPLRLQGVELHSRSQVSQELLAKVGLAGAAEKYPRQLSGGMKMRVSIARALSVKPKLLLLDEPFGALDEMTRNNLNEELLRIRSEKLWSALFVTHSVAEAVFLSSRVLVMAANPGRVAHIVDIPLAYPRTHETREDVAFSDLVRKVTKALHSVKNMSFQGVSDSSLSLETGSQRYVC